MAKEYFGYDTAISDITTTFHDGINVLFAQEKGGKTTLLKAIAGIVPYVGLITLDGVSLSELSIKERDFQMLFDDYALFSRRSARYNLEYPLKLRKIPKAERRTRVEAVAELFDLDLMIDAPVYRLNEWHKVSLVLCRAYLREAKVLLIDNIFSRLDPQSRREAFLRFLPLFAERGIVIYATDEVFEAESLSREIKFLSCGYLLQEGAPQDFIEKPACSAAFSAFTDYATMLPCGLKKEGIMLFDKEFPFDLSALLSEEYYEKEVIAGFRPDDFLLSEDGFSALIKGRFYYGNRIVYRLEKEGCTVWAFGESSWKVGEQVNVKPNRAPKLFDPINERSIVRY